MKLSDLQRYALIECYNRRAARVPRLAVHSFYRNAPNRPGHVQDVVTKSLEALIDRGFLIGYGRRTPKKWFIDEIRLTPRGKKTARILLGQQLVLPLSRRRKKPSNSINVKPL